MHLTLKTRVLIIFLESLSAQCSLHGEFGPKPNVEQDGVANITPMYLVEQLFKEVGILDLSDQQ